MDLTFAFQTSTSVAIIFIGAVLIVATIITFTKDIVKYHRKKDGFKVGMYSILLIVIEWIILMLMFLFISGIMSL